MCTKTNQRPARAQSIEWTPQSPFCGQCRVMKYVHNIEKDKMSLLVFILYCFVFLHITVWGTTFARYVIISIELCPFVAISCLLTPMLREVEGSMGGKKRRFVCINIITWPARPVNSKLEAEV